MSFINTIDQHGDEMVFKSIVEGTITEFKDDVLQEVGDYAFYKREQLTTVDLPAVTSIGEYAFYECEALTSLNVPKLLSFEIYAFAGCEALKSIELPLVEAVANYSFRYCYALERVDLARATSIGNYAFHLDGALTTLIVRTDTMCTMSNVNALQGSAIANGTGYIYVPRALIEEYKVATGWRTYAAQFRAIEDYPEICG